MTPKEKANDILDNFWLINKFNAKSVVPREEPKVKYTLKRMDDGLTSVGHTVQYIQWNDDRTAHSTHDNIEVGRSCILNPGISYMWLTTVITEVLEQTSHYVKFKTKNSTYELITKKHDI